jgi:gluconolactonase
VTKIAEGMYFPNGLAIESRTLVIAETYSWRIWKGEWDSAARRWRNAAPWAETGGPVGPDGLAFGPDGLLYAAVYGQRSVKGFDAAGKLARKVATAGKNPTNVAFDPSGTLGMVVTEAEQGCLWSFPT